MFRTHQGARRRNRTVSCHVLSRASAVSGHGPLHPTRGYLRGKPLVIAGPSCDLASFGPQSPMAQKELVLKRWGPAERCWQRRHEIRMRPTTLPIVTVEGYRLDVQAWAGQSEPEMNRPFTLGATQGPTPKPT